jgi:hypothetical protein
MFLPFPASHSKEREIQDMGLDSGCGVGTLDSGYGVGTGVAK